MATCGDLRRRACSTSAGNSASWTRLVDLDAAFGRGNNASFLAEVIAAVDVDVGLSGGIRDDQSSTLLSRWDAEGSISARPPSKDPSGARAIEQHGDQIVIGLEVRGHTLAARGWTRDLGDLFDALDRLNDARCQRYVVTDIDRDGVLQGPNLELLRAVCARTESPVIASGGVRSVADVVALSELTAIGVEGAIIGTALYSGDLRLEDALAAANSR